MGNAKQPDLPSYLPPSIPERKFLKGREYDYNKDLWWLCFEYLAAKEADFNQSHNVWKLLEAEQRSHFGPPEIAQAAATRVIPVLEAARTLTPDSLDLASVSLARSVDPFLEILSVIQGNLRFQTGGIPWTCILTAAHVRTYPQKLLPTLPTLHTLMKISRIY